MRVLDLFSGIGGFSLGLERAGMQTVAFCEIEPYCRAVLKKHWPEVPCYDDIKTLTADRLAADGIYPDILCGGFPCQDISTAGKGAGIEGERSGLWSEYARLIGELRPQYAIVENVAALLGRGLGRVLGDLAALGYDAEWHCIPASAVGAPHRRDRIWIVAYPYGSGYVHWESEKLTAETRLPTFRESVSGDSSLADSQSPKRQGQRDEQSREQNGFTNSGQVLAYTASLRCSRPRLFAEWCGSETDGSWQAIDAFASGIGCQWSIEPDVGRVANGIPARVDRLKALGNAVVPQIPEIIGRAILSESK